ncbi:hypothetical protein CHLRE_10g426750v5 [Chlamydomonas reinhardtii]|uniref:Uncharacterized protein n=1 Tax=Chlamydomonas reinhardtii TaxID=3055 RepID=A8IC18_CHLRE|nr:uncharacterized protein CHLRE_10g426750v5 [Chlamydomonas reinhardtii]PNW77209.1 hypothetical protein CHLRE_10g426750v5 [Chlamydomonas reinhardtii]|eukprot:XP_001702554.1 cytochrome P450, CYP85 clan [Chlamydomonas reinhardtii]
MGEQGAAAGTPLALAATLLAGTILVFYIYQQLKPSKSRLPGPLFSWPFLGDTIEFATTDPTKFLFGRFKRYGRVFRLSLLGFTAYVTADPEALRPLLADEGGHFTIPVQTFTALMGAYNLQAHKEVHAAWRKVLMAALTGSGMAKLVPGVVAVMGRHVEGWAQAGRVELYEAARTLGLDLAVDVLSGVKLEERGIQPAWLKSRMADFLGGLYGLPLALPGSPLAKALAAKEELLRVLVPAVEGRQQELLKLWEDNDRSAAAVATKLASSPETATIADANLLGFTARGCTTPRDAAMTVLHAVMGAADTTRFALFNTWAILAMSPRVQDLIYEEQKKVVAENGPELTYKTAMSMPYLDAAFKEAMRLLPASAGGFRMLTKELRVGDVLLPPGTIIWFHALLLQTLDPVLWDGDTSVDVPVHMDWRNNFEGAFRPERWLSEETKPRSYYIFGQGAHLCAGMVLVTLEVKLLLAMVLRKWRLQLEVPDMLARAELFPYTKPAKGTGGMRLIAREQPVA